MEPTDVLPRIINTCAIDTILFVMYHMRRINSVVESEIRKENGIIESYKGLGTKTWLNQAEGLESKREKERERARESLLSGGPQSKRQCDER